MNQKINLVLFFYTIFFITLLYAQQGQPTLLLPENNSENISTKPVHFEWGLVDSALFYEIYVDDNSNFASLIHQNIVYGFSTEVYEVFNNWNFYWKIRAGRDNESGEQEFGEWSETYSFSSIYLPAENISPLDGSIEEDFLSVNLKWEINLDPLIEQEDYNFHIQLSRNNSFTEIVREQNILNSKNTIVEDLEPNTEYYWRVKYSNTFGESNWSEVTQFQTNQSDLGKVALYYPENNSSAVFPLNVLFEWENISNAESYNFELATDSLFNNIIESNSQAGTELLLNIMLYNSNLFWRVQAENGNTKGAWSVTWSFITSTAAPQSPPNLIFPPPSFNTSFIDSLQFKWASVYSALNYFLEISGDDNFENILYSNSILDTSTVIKHIFEDDKKYYWRVQSENEKGHGPKSEVRSFSFGNVTSFENKNFVEK